MSHYPEFLQKCRKLNPHRHCEAQLKVCLESIRLKDTASPKQSHGSTFETKSEQEDCFVTSSPKNAVNTNTLQICPNNVPRNDELQRNNNYTIGYRQIESNDTSIFAYIPGQGLHVYSQSGELLSKVPAPSSLPPNSIGEFGAGPTLYQQILYVPVGKLLFSYDVSKPEELNLLWLRELPSNELVSSAFTALAVDSQGIIYAGVAQEGSFSIQALDPANGQTIWIADTSLNNDQNSAGIPTALTVVGGKVIAAVLGPSTIQAFERSTGVRVYTSENLTGLCPDGSGSIESFEVGEGNLYMSPSAGTCVYSINGETGKVLWTHSSRVDPDTSFTYGGTPKYVNGVVYASNSALWALDAKTGKVLAISSNRDDDAIFTNVQYANGEILVWGKNLTAYKPIR